MVTTSLDKVKGSNGYEACKVISRYQNESIWRGVGRSGLLLFPLSPYFDCFGDTETFFAYMYDNFTLAEVGSGGMFHIHRTRSNPEHIVGRRVRIRAIALADYLAFHLLDAPCYWQTINNKIIVWPGSG